jgi:hypothetical protein
MQDSSNRTDHQRNEKPDDGTRPQQAGEAETTRFGMEEGDNTDIPATGPASRDE